jgi:hypothetical protein
MDRTLALIVPTPCRTHLADRGKLRRYRKRERKKVTILSRCSGLTLRHTRSQVNNQVSPGTKEELDPDSKESECLFLLSAGGTLVLPYARRIAANCRLRWESVNVARNVLPPKVATPFVAGPSPGLCGDTDRTRRRVGPLSPGHPLPTNRRGPKTSSFVNFSAAS